ncbi:hypothetical protein QYM41_17075 [Kocuria sp. CPCC 205268]|uniref:hypothetical protein n=1 Tax=Kocuria oxytropis TaxID=3058913 RepID=UPI0034D52AD6
MSQQHPGSTTAATGETTGAETDPSPLRAVREDPGAAPAVPVHCGRPMPVRTLDFTEVQDRVNHAVAQAAVEGRQVHACACGFLQEAPLTGAAAVSIVPDGETMLFRPFFTRRVLAAAGRVESAEWSFDQALADAGPLAGPDAGSWSAGSPQGSTGDSGSAGSGFAGSSTGDSGSAGSNSGDSGSTDTGSTEDGAAGPGETAQRLCAFEAGLEAERWRLDQAVETLRDELRLAVRHGVPIPLLAREAALDEADVVDLLHLGDVPGGARHAEPDPALAAAC